MVVVFHRERAFACPFARACLHFIGRWFGPPEGELECLRSPSLLIRAWLACVEPIASLVWFSVWLVSLRGSAVTHDAQREKIQTTQQKVTLLFFKKQLKAIGLYYLLLLLEHMCKISYILYFLIFFFFPLLQVIRFVMTFRSNVMIGFTFAFCLSVADGVLTGFLAFICYWFMVKPCKSCAAEIRSNIILVGFRISIKIESAIAFFSSPSDLIKWCKMAPEVRFFIWTSHHGSLVNMWFLVSFLFSGFWCATIGNSVRNQRADVGWTR